MSDYVPILIVFAIAATLAGAIPLLSWILGPKRPTVAKLDVYECGLKPVGGARERFSVKFYLVAILFLIFDIEIAFMYPWAVYYSDGIKLGQGLYLLLVMGIFFAVLTLGLIYEWRQGALDWSSVASSRQGEA